MKLYKIHGCTRNIILHKLGLTCLFPTFKGFIIRPGNGAGMVQETIPWPRPAPKSYNPSPPDYVQKKEYLHSCKRRECRERAMKDWSKFMKNQYFDRIFNLARCSDLFCEIGWSNSMENIREEKEFEYMDVRICKLSLNKNGRRSYYRWKERDGGIIFPRERLTKSKLGFKIK